MTIIPLKQETFYHDDKLTIRCMISYKENTLSVSTWAIGSSASTLSPGSVHKT